MTCLKSLIRLRMEEEAVFKSPKCLTNAALPPRIKINGPVGCFAVAQHHVLGLCLLAEV